MDSECVSLGSDLRSVRRVILHQQACQYIGLLYFACRHLDHAMVLFCVCRSFKKQDFSTAVPGRLSDHGTDGDIVGRRGETPDKDPTGRQKSARSACVLCMRSLLHAGVLLMLWWRCFIRLKKGALVAFVRKSIFFSSSSPKIHQNAYSSLSGQQAKCNAYVHIGTHQGMSLTAATWKAHNGSGHGRANMPQRSVVPRQS
ncbi:hypothetical protein BN1708_014730 [Verticillium longisporum]|uniref:Uncharacterized protein n=1 Tax=Verticillium longisporum TaxID=100787 RepID=A0A0G4LYY4_VERLO|nr:hypothetical protein BN1708_014730 [Verticillium longisporum]